MDIKTKFKVGDVVFFLTENDAYHTPSTGRIHLLKGRVDHIYINYSSSHMTLIEYQVFVDIYAKQLEFKIREEYLSDNVTEILNRITDQSPQNIRAKLSKVNDWTDDL
jgi:hypothetical protein